MNLLGIDIGGTKTLVCVGDEHGSLLASERMPTRAEDGPSGWLPRVQALIEDVLEQAHWTMEAIEAVGVSCPGPVSVKKQLILDPPNMQGWVNVPIVQLLADALKRPVYMNNDANACALAEYYFGSHKGVDHLAYLTMSTGLGCGFVINGELVQGACDVAGEIGHVVLDPNGPLCPCGQRGCIEMYCGGKNVARRLREMIRRDSVQTALWDLVDGDLEAIDFKTFTDAVRRQDAFALEQWDAYLERLAQGVGMVIQCMNPEVIVMGTIAIHEQDILLPPLHKKLKHYAWHHGREACTIVPSALGSRIGGLSAIALAVKR